MPLDLPDVNAFIALFDPTHVHHEPAHAWFSTASQTGWATTAITENGLVRITSNPRYVNGPISAVDSTRNLREFKANHAESFSFLQSDVSIADDSLFDLTRIQGHNQITDLYLVGLCHHHGARLVTFDAAIAGLTNFVHGVGVDSVLVLSV